MFRLVHIGHQIDHESKNEKEENFQRCMGGLRYLTFTILLLYRIHKITVQP